ncbi:MAG: hypothetical protein NW218_16450 [Saprospiraceae bacterium]|nr:hypothetical protein [Saprospiraceae bacterium]
MFNRNYLPIRVWAFAVILLFSQSACRFYQASPISINRIQQLDRKKVTLYLVDSENALSNAWRLNNYSCRKNTISCSAAKLPPEEIKQVIQTKSKKAAQENGKNVYLYAKPALVAEIQKGDSIQVFEYEQLDRMIVVEPDIRKSANTSALIVLVIFLRLGGVFL